MMAIRQNEGKEGMDVMDWKKRLLALGVFLVLLASGIRMPGQRQAMAAENGPGTLTVQLDDIGTPRGGTGFTAYAVGSLEEGQWILDESLAGTGVDLNSLTYADEWDAAALKLARAAGDAALEGRSGQTDGAGTLALAGLAAGMYLVVQDSGEDTYGTVSPFLAGLPGRAEDGSAQWAVAVHPKAELPAETDAGRIEVTKRAGYLDPDLLEVIDLIPEDSTYYVGIFQDSRGTVPYGTDYLREIRLQGAGSGTAVFEGLPAGTYYIFETDSAGNAYAVNEVQKQDGYSWACQVEEGSSQEVTLDGKAESPAGTVALYNLYYDMPGGYSYNGNITIEKAVLENGVQTTAEETFYAGIFRDPAGTDLYEVTELTQNGSVTVEAPLGGEDGDEDITYYIYETDENGQRLDKSTFGYLVSGEGSVTLTSGRLHGEILLTNTKKEPTPTPTVAPTTAPTVTPTTAPGGTTATPGGTGGTGTTPNVQDSGTTSAASVRTGDDTPILMYVLLAAIALGIALGGAVFLKGRKKHE